MIDRFNHRPHGQHAVMASRRLDAMLNLSHAEQRTNAVLNSHEIILSVLAVQAGLQAAEHRFLPRLARIGKGVKPADSQLVNPLRQVIAPLFRCHDNNAVNILRLLKTLQRVGKDRFSANFDVLFGAIAHLHAGADAARHNDRIVHAFSIPFVSQSHPHSAADAIHPL